MGMGNNNIIPFINSFSFKIFLEWKPSENILIIIIHYIAIYLKTKFPNSFIYSFTYVGASAHLPNISSGTCEHFVLSSRWKGES